jgi:hypothetical protein
MISSLINSSNVTPCFGHSVIQEDWVTCVCGLSIHQTWWCRQSRSPKCQFLTQLWYCLLPGRNIVHIFAIKSYTVFTCSLGITLRKCDSSTYSVYKETWCFQHGLIYDLKNWINYNFPMTYSNRANGGVKQVFYVVWFQESVFGFSLRWSTIWWWDLNFFNRHSMWW